MTVAAGLPAALAGPVHVYLFVLESLRSDRTRARAASVQGLFPLLALAALGAAVL